MPNGLGLASSHGLLLGVKNASSTDPRLPDLLKPLCSALGFFVELHKATRLHISHSGHAMALPSRTQTALYTSLKPLCSALVSSSSCARPTEGCLSCLGHAPALPARVQTILDSLLSTASLRSGFLRRAARCNAGTASYAIAFGAKPTPNAIARLPDPLSAHRSALVSSCDRGFHDRPCVIQGVCDDDFVHNLGGVGSGFDLWLHAFGDDVGGDELGGFLWGQLGDNAAGF